MRRAPAADRNKEFILQKLKTILPETCRKIIEIASGTGQHITHFAKAFPNITWQPTEYDRSDFSSIQAYIDHEGLNNVQAPVYVDICEPVDKWLSDIPKDQTLDTIYCANMIHISPWTCTLGLFKAAGQLLKMDGLLITYGPYAVDGVLTPDSNIQFDAGLRAQNSEWGVRDLRDLIKLGTDNGLQFQVSHEMPANNKILIFKKVE